MGWHQKLKKNFLKKKENNNESDNVYKYTVKFEDIEEGDK